MRLKVGDVQVYLTDTGSGIPTLFLHGSPDSSHMWAPLIQEMPAGFRCIAPDLPGFGRSITSGNFKFTLENEATWVDGVVTGMGIKEPVNLVVHDFGGPFGFAWAILNPNKVRRIAIFNTSFSSEYRWHKWARIMRTPVLGEALILLNSEKAFIRTFKKFAPLLPTEHVAQTFGLYTPSVRQNMLRLYRATNPAKLGRWEERLRVVTERTPTIVLWGDKDPFIEARFAEKFHAERVEHFPEFSHWLPVEAPREMAAKLAKFFLA